MKVLGVLGGMGPAATVAFLARLQALTPATCDEDHIRVLMDMNPQVPNRHRDEPGAKRVLGEMAERLREAGAEVLAMPCNTAHHYAPQIAAAVSVPLLNMVDLSVVHAVRCAPDAANIGMLASPAVQRAGVFDAAFRGANLSALWPKDADRMLHAIRSIKAHGPTSEARQTLQDAAHELVGNGADLLFVACSEFSLLAPDLHAAVPVIDTVDVLARAIRDHTQMESS